MRKFLLFIAALCCATSLWADCPSSYSDTIPAPRYLTNFQIHLGTPTMLTFTDEFRNDLQLDRAYSIYIHPRHIYDLEDGCKFFRNGEGKYFYGSGSFSHERAYDAVHVDGSYGGVQTVDVNELVAACLEAGDTDVIFLVSPHYLSEDDVVMSNMYRSYYLEADYHNNYDFINYYTCKLPKLVTFDVSTPSKVVRYGDNIELNCTVQAAGQARVVFSESDQPDGDQRVIYDYTLSASEAGAGKVVSYHKSFIDDDMPATRYYHVALWLPDGKADELSTSLNFQYPLTINSGTPAYYSPGEQITVPKSDCGSYSVRTVNDVPVTLTDNGSSWTLTMPACAVWLKNNTAQYKVQFRDYDNSVLKTENVACGSYATAPDISPSHAGMTFAGWDKDINQPIYAPTVFRAKYTVDGAEAVLSVQGDHTSAVQGETLTFNMYVKTSTEVQTTVYLQAAWLDDENDELQWGTLGSYTGYTKAEAAAGTTKTVERVVLPYGSLNGGHRARYYRLQMRLQGSSNDIYSNIVRIDTYYEVTVDNRVGDLTAYLPAPDGQPLFKYTDGKIYARPQDMIYALDNDALACGLKFQLSPTAYAVNSGDFWIEMPADLGEATTLTISREKHQVAFYLEGKQVYNPGEYEPQQVFCGNAATPPDIIAEVPEGKLFRGWKARGEYADDAYNYVTKDMIFDALLEDNPEGIEQIPVPQDKARKYMIHGQIYIALPDGKVFDVRGLRVR